MNIIEAEQTNIKLIYEYTEATLKSINGSIGTLNTKLSGVIGFSSVLLKFASDLRSDSVWLLGAKATICLFLVLAIWAGFAGLQPRSVGDKVHPEELRQDFYYSSEEDCRRYIIDNWIRAINQLDGSRDEKCRHLNRSIVCFVLASTLFGADAILVPLLFP